MTGWFFASFRGWQVSLLFGVPLPMLAAPKSAAGRLVGGWHEAAGLGLLIAIGVHVAAAFIHPFCLPRPDNAAHASRNVST